MQKDVHRRFKFRYKLDKEEFNSSLTINFLRIRGLMSKNYSKSTKITLKDEKHWYKCENGHLFCKGECERAMEFLFAQNKN